MTEFQILNGITTEFKSEVQRVNGYFTEVSL